mgnify:CR=1 FL=1
MASRLIQGAGNVYGKSAQIQMQAANRPSYNPNAQNAINQSAGRANYMRKLQEYRNDQIVKGYINQIPDGFDTSQLPVAYRPGIKDKLTEFRKEARDVITQYLSGTYDPAQDEYVEGLQKLDAIKQKIRVMEQGFKNFGAGKTEFLKDYSDKNFSSANNLENMSNLSNLFTDQIPMEIDSETGNPTWAGKTYNEHMANQPFNKAYTEAGKYTNFAQKMYKAGVPMDDATKIMYGNEINLMLDKGGWEVTRSLVKDNILGDNFLKDQQPLVDQLIEQGNSQDPQVAYEAREQLNNLLKDRMLENLNTMALKGQQVNASKVTPPNPEGTTSFNVEEYYKETFGLPIYEPNEENKPVASYNIDVGDNPATSDLGIYLQNQGYMLEKVEDGGGVYMMDGFEASKNEVLDAAKASAGAGWANMSREQKLKKINEVSEFIPNTSGGYTIKPAKGADAATRNLNKVKININDPASVQNAIDRLSKLNL